MFPSSYLFAFVDNSCGSRVISVCRDGSYHTPTRCELLCLRLKKIKSPTSNAIIATGTATPIAAFTPVGNPPELSLELELELVCDVAAPFVVEVGPDDEEPVRSLLFHRISTIGASRSIVVTACCVALPVIVPGSVIVSLKASLGHLLTVTTSPLVAVLVHD